MQKKEKFSFRKYGKVLAPAVIGLVGLTITNTASADEVKSVTTENLTVAPVTVSTPPKVEQPVIANSQEVTTEVIKSPVTYVANDNLEVGKENVVTQGQAGKLEFSQNNEGIPTVTRTNPTETKVEVGTKPVVKEEVDKHTVTYELDETKNFGDNVEVKGQDGIKKTSTTYKVQTEIDPKLLLPQSEDDKRLQTPTTSYYAELTKNIDINSLKTKEEHLEVLENLALIWRLDLIIGENLMNLIPETGDSKSTEDIKRFHNSNYISDEHIDTIKSDYKLAKELVAKIITEYGELSTVNGEYSEKRKVENLIGALEYLIKLHEEKSSDLNSIPTLKINNSYELPEDVIKKFEGELNKLPVEVRKIVPTIIIGDSKLAGAASQSSNVIRIKDTTRLLQVFLHELGHIVDYKGGISKELYDQDGNGKIERSIYAFSHSPEWLDLFKKYFAENQHINDYISDNEDRKLVGRATSEAFAESFSEYILKKIYGIGYTRYVKNFWEYDGKSYNTHLEVRPGETVKVTTPDNKPYPGKSVRELLTDDNVVYEVSYDDAYEVFSKVEPYFERLYNQLFEQPRVAKAVIDKTTTEKVQDRVDGKVVYGAKPTEKTEVITHTTVYKADESKDFGFENIATGKDGKKVVRTSYVLVNNKPEAKETILVDEKAQDKVIVKGTKPKVDIQTTARKIIYKADETKDYGYRVTETEGKDGKVITTITYTLDPVTGEVKANTPIIQTVSVEDKVMVVGTKSKVEEKVVPFVIEYKEDANLAEGQERVETEGVNGVEKTTITYTLDTATGKVIANTPTITTKPVVNKVIVKGTKKAVVPTPVVVKPTETKVEVPVVVKPTETKVEVPVVVKPTETKAEVPVFSKEEALFQEEKPNLDESLFTTTSKGESVTETKPELHLIPTVDGSVQAKTEALFQEEKPELPVSLILTNNTQTKTTTSKEDVEKQVLNAVRKLEKRASKETSNKVLPKTTAVSNSSSDIATVGAIGLALATLLGSRRRNK